MRVRVMLTVKQLVLQSDGCAKSLIDRILFLLTSPHSYRLILVGLCFLVVGSTCYEYYLLKIQDNDTTKSVYYSYLVTFSAINNTRALFDDDTQHHLGSADTLVLVFVTLEFIGRSYVLPVFYGMMNIKRPLNGLPNEYFTAKKFFFIRGSSFAACTYVLARCVTQ